MRGLFVSVALAISLAGCAEQPPSEPPAADSGPPPTNTAIQPAQLIVPISIGSVSGGTSQTKELLMGSGYKNDDFRSALSDVLTSKNMLAYNADTAKYHVDCDIDLSFAFSVIDKIVVADVKYRVYSRTSEAPVFFTEVRNSYSQKSLLKSGAAVGVLLGGQYVIESLGQQTAELAYANAAQENAKIFIDRLYQSKLLTVTNPLVGLPSSALMP